MRPLTPIYSLHNRLRGLEGRLRTYLEDPRRFGPLHLTLEHSGPTMTLLTDIVCLCTDIEASGHVWRLLSWARIDIGHPGYSRTFQPFRGRSWVFWSLPELSRPS